MPATEHSLDAVLGLLNRYRALVLTGAGVSTDSGIPDYRGPNSPARTPMTFQEFVSGPIPRQRYWARSHLGWHRMRVADPNASHFALARLQAAGRLTGLITQNVDGLHERAGHREVIDLHGRIDQVVCLDCHQLSARTRLQNRLDELNPGHADRPVEFAPDGDAVVDDTTDFRVAACERCGGILKPDVVFFGESVPKERVAQCRQLVEEAEFLLVLGSSLHVMSGLRFVRQAHRHGIPIAIVNRGSTRGDELADVKIEAGVAQTLTAVLERTS